MNVAEVLRAHVATRPQARAIVAVRRGLPRNLSFAGLDRASARGAALLRRHGLVPGDAVLVFQPMSPELYVVLVALLRLGLVATFVDPSAGRDHIERCCALVRPRALIAGPAVQLLRLVAPALRRIPLVFGLGFGLPGAVRWAEADRLPPHDPIAETTPETGALLTFTSGTTGEPKAVLRTHGLLLAQQQALARALPRGAGEADLTTLPILVLSNLAMGVTSVIADADLRQPGAIDPAPVIAQLETEPLTSTVASPALLERLTRGCAERGLVLPQLKRIVAGGAPVFPHLLDALQRIAPNAEIVALYGSTEAEPIARLSRSEITPDDRLAMARGCGLLLGRPVDGADVAVLPDRWGRAIGPYSASELEALRRGPGEAGEIIVRGDHVLPGYWKGFGDAETKLGVDDAVWHRTGDAGSFDARGRLWLLGRCAARIDDRHGTLYALAVECALSRHPGIRRSAVVAHRGRRILAVEPDAAIPLDPADLPALVPWARLEGVETCRRLPVDRRHNAKIDYPALRRLLDAR